jgi:NAD+ synthase
MDMSKKKIYRLNEQQLKFFREFEKIAKQNTWKMISQAAEFIIKQQRKAERTKAVIGLSGGIDSSFTAALLVQALGKENVIGVKMPYEGVSSDESAKYADMIIDFLKLPKENIFEIPIKEPVDATLKGIKKADIVLEPLDVGNIMARERMKNLYAIARFKNGMVIDTCNKTEVLLGYFTRYGDGASDYNPVGGIYKTWVWELAKYLGVPEEIVKRKPTAELSSGQNDEDDLGISYFAVDLMLWLLFEKRMPVKDLMAEYNYPKEVVEMVISRVKNNRFKNELPPLLKIEL